MVCVGIVPEEILCYEVCVRVRPGRVVTPMVATDSLGSILNLSPVVRGFSLFKDNIHMRSECDTSVNKSFVTASSCSQLVSGAGRGGGSLRPVGEQGPGGLAPRLPWALRENPVKATEVFFAVAVFWGFFPLCLTLTVSL